VSGVYKFSKSLKFLSFLNLQTTAVCSSFDEAFEYSNLMAVESVDNSKNKLKLIERNFPWFNSKYCFHFWQKVTKKLEN